MIQIFFHNLFNLNNIIYLMQQCVKVDNDKTLSLLIKYLVWTISKSNKATKGDIPVSITWTRLLTIYHF